MKKHFSWHPKAWARHLELWPDTVSACSSSAHDWQVFAMKNGSLVALNSYTAEEFIIEGKGLDDYRTATMGGDTLSMLVGCAE